MSTSDKPQTGKSTDVDSVETQEWLDSLEAVLDREGLNARTFCSSN